MEKKPKEKSKYFILAFLEFPQKQVEINIESHLFNFSFFFSFKFKAASYLNITLTPAFRVGPNIFRAKHAARDGRQGLSHFGNQTRNQFLTLQQPPSPSLPFMPRRVGIQDEPKVRSLSFSSHQAAPFPTPSKSKTTKQRGIRDEPTELSLVQVLAHIVPQHSTAEQVVSKHHSQQQHRDFT